MANPKLDKHTELKDCYIIEPNVFGDASGYYTPFFIEENNIKEGLTYAFEKYYGTTFNGIKLNKWNLAAAAHLGGRGTLNKLLRGDIKDFADANGTTVISRLKEFEDIG